MRVIDIPVGKIYVPAAKKKTATKKSTSETAE